MFPLVSTIAACPASTELSHRESRLADLISDWVVQRVITRPTAL
jgi:hypothetical protein